MVKHWLKSIQLNALIPRSPNKTISPELLQKYRKDCINLVPDAVFEIVQKEGDETDPIHLLWMLNQIEFDTTMSETKRHRWLGYVQGILVTKGVFTVQEEREYTRDIFKGF